MNRFNQTVPALLLSNDGSYISKGPLFRLYFDGEILIYLQCSPYWQRTESVVSHLTLIDLLKGNPHKIHTKTVDSV